VQQKILNSSTPCSSSAVVTLKVELDSSYYLSGCAVWSWGAGTAHAYAFSVMSCHCGVAQGN
jgi:hypothetical protein